MAPENESYQADQVWCKGIEQIEDNAGECRRDRSQGRR